MREEKKTGSRRGELVLGAVSGFVSGFFGAGGGVVLLLCGKRLVREWRGLEAKELFASTVAVTAALSLVSVGVYLVRGDLSWDQVPRFLPSALLGGALGAWLLDRLPTTAIRVIFGVITVIGGVLMIAR